MLLIHVPRVTNRLGYTLNVLFHHIFRVDYELTVDEELFTSHEGPKLCYGPHPVGDAPFLKSSSLLFQTTIEEQSLRCQPVNGITALFPVHNAASILPFDLFSAAFYCLSRYEEYLPHFTDMHGRFPASECVASREGFLGKLVVDRWVMMLLEKLKDCYQDFHIPSRPFTLENTIDIDAAYCYKHKGFIRSVVGLGRDLFSPTQTSDFHRRLRVMFRKEPDPFDSFDYIINVHNSYPSFKLKFFPLMADYNVYDKPINYQNPEFRQLLQHLCDYAKMGLHASYASHDDASLIANESERLSSLLHRKTVRNRYHFLRLSLPESYNVLIENGILHDYTMGYADMPGFRSGTCMPYPFFDLESDCETPLFIHPFAVMDSTFYYYKKSTVEEAWNSYRELLDEAVEMGGVISLLWHNQSLCESFGWQGWRGLYERVLDYADSAVK